MLALLNIFDRLVYSAFPDSERLGGYAYATSVKRLHGYLKALVDVSKKVLLRYYAVFHYELARRRTAYAHLFFFLPHTEALKCALYYKCGYSARPERFVGHGKYDEYVGMAGVGNKYLCSVEHPMIPVEHRFCLLPCGIRSGARLGQSERADVLAA